MDGEPFEAVISKYGLPSIAFPHCTRELKINPIKAFIREHLGLQKDEYVEAIGMRFDEPKRVKNDPNYIYPLYDLGVTKQHVNDFFRKITIVAKSTDFRLKNLKGTATSATKNRIQN